jgi:hypothetical protein
MKKKRRKNHHLPKKKKPTSQINFQLGKKRENLKTEVKTEPLDLENFGTFTLIPQTLIIKGEMLAENKKKRTDLFFTVNFPCC